MIYDDENDDGEESWDSRGNVVTDRITLGVVGWCMDEIPPLFLS